MDIDIKSIGVEILSTYDASEVLSILDPELSSCMQEDALADDLPFFKVSYPFGAKIIHDGEVFFPLKNGGSISFNDPTLPAILREHLSYTPGVNNPVGIILTKESEFYQQFDDGRIESYQIMIPGQTIGFASVIDSVSSKNKGNPKRAYISDCNLDAGARMLFMLANISNSRQHNNLLESYGIDFEKPIDYTQQCPIFRAISKSVDSPWKQEILFISTKFLKKLKTSSEYETLYKQFVQIHRSAYTMWHYAIRTWESEINRVLSATGANKYSSYAVSIAKHLFLIVAGGAPGFAPVIDDRMCPNLLIEEAYTTNGYNLTEQWPNLMQPELFNLDSKQPLYYSPNLPTLLN
ncbi:MAG TPA: hypothetical protein VKR58_06600, partial [Aquella sp.]|nr:hypothetical protein [Aquella sp.]